MTRTNFSLLASSVRDSHRVDFARPILFLSSSPIRGLSCLFPVGSDRRANMASPVLSVRGSKNGPCDSAVWGLARVQAVGPTDARVTDSELSAGGRRNYAAWRVRPGSASSLAK